VDLLIATAAVVDDGPLVTRNFREFERVPGLDVLSY
jgi:predicted nucleic acid-binding protein